MRRVNGRRGDGDHTFLQPAAGGRHDAAAGAMWIKLF
jgi:hypothetical protein